MKGMLSQMSNGSSDGGSDSWAALKAAHECDVFMSVPFQELMRPFIYLRPTTFIYLRLSTFLCLRLIACIRFAVEYFICLRLIGFIQGTMLGDYQSLRTSLLHYCTAEYFITYAKHSIYVARSLGITHYST